MSDEEKNQDRSGGMEAIAGILGRAWKSPEFQARMAENEAYWKRKEAQRQREAEEALITQRRGYLRETGLANVDIDRIIDGRISETEPLRYVTAWLESGASSTRKLEGSPQSPETSEKFRPWLILCGGVGCGKSWAAAHAMLALYGGHYLRASELCARIEPWGDEKKLYELASPRNVVVLDDMGAEREDKRFTECLLRVLEARANVPLLITSNLPRTAFRGRYDARVIDRLNHFGLAIEVKGTSVRRGDGGL